MKPPARKLLKKIIEQKPEPDSERLERALSRSGIPDRVPFMEDINISDPNADP